MTLLVIYDTFIDNKCQSHQKMVLYRQYQNFALTSLEADFSEKLSKEA